MAAKDWRDIYKQYKGQWVALQEDRVTVIAAAQTLQEVMEASSRLGYPNPSVTKIPQDLRIFVG